MMKIKVKFNIVSVLKIVVVVTVLSQIQVIHNYLRPIVFLGWGLLALLGLIFRNRFFQISKANRVFVVSYACLLLYCTLMSVFSNIDYYSVYYLKTLIIPLAVVITINCFSKSVNELEFLSIIKVFIVASVIYAAYVNVTYFPSLNAWLQQIMYIFDDKNSASQIWSLSVLLCIYVDKCSETKNWVWRGLALYLLLIIALSQCRTAILGLVVGYLFYIIFYSKKKIGHLFVILGVSVASIAIPRIYQYAHKVIFIQSSYSTDANIFSSGRLGIYNEAIQLIRQNPIFGSGRYYVDCSYLMILCELGVIGLIIIETIWFSRIVDNIRIKTDNSITKIVSVATVFYIVSSILEGLPPFGPGAATFMFWVLSGYNDKLKLSYKGIDHIT